jgi:hypothetical protein
MGGWVDPGAGLDTGEGKNLAMHVALHYTDWAVAAPSSQFDNNNKAIITKDDEITDSLIGFSTGPQISIPVCNTLSISTAQAIGWCVSIFDIAVCKTGCNLGNSTVLREMLLKRSHPDYSFKVIHCDLASCVYLPCGFKMAMNFHHSVAKY